MITIWLGRLPLGLAAVIHLTELVAHGVELACATGQERLLDEEQCAGLLGAMHAMGGVDAYRMPGIFGPAVAARPGAAPHEQLAAYLGLRSLHRRHPGFPPLTAWVIGGPEQGSAGIPRPKVTRTARCTPAPFLIHPVIARHLGRPRSPTAAASRRSAAAPRPGTFGPR